MMKLETYEGQTAFAPGDTIDGLATWDLDDEPSAIEIRLIWYTTGKGTRDSAVVDVHRFERPAASDVQTFSFAAPAGPSSFSGRLVSLTWAIELQSTNDKKRAVRVGLVIGDGRREASAQDAVDLYADDD